MIQRHLGSGTQAGLGSLGAEIHERSASFSHWKIPVSAGRDFLDRYEVHQVGGRTIVEYWNPAEDLAEFNRNLVGPIELVASFV